MSAKKTRKTLKTVRPLPTANIVARKIGETKADVSEYVRSRTAAGNISLHNGDKVAKQLAGKELDDVYAAAAKVLDVSQTSLKSRYSHLNAGMQRMNLGNLIRGAARAEG